MYFILTAGPSGSGKSTIVEIIKKGLMEKDLRVHIISMDQFYKSQVPCSTPNWDDISALDIDLLHKVLYDLKGGHEVHVPRYDYTTHQRIPDSYTIKDIDVLIVEGIFALWDPEIRQLSDLSLFVDADIMKSCLMRRYERDTASRGRSGASIITQYLDQVVPGYKKYVEPTKKYADVCFVNELEFPSKNTKIIKMIVNYVDSTCRQR